MNHGDHRKGGGNDDRAERVRGSGYRVSASQFLIGTVGQIPSITVAKNYVHNIFTGLTPRCVDGGHMQEWNDQIWMSK